MAQTYGSGEADMGTTTRRITIGRRHRARRAIVAVASTALVVGTTVIGSPTSTTAAGESVPTLDGSNSHDAASSCWEIKQLHPASGDGQYWLRNSSLERPEQFYCDMTTDGGGWVLIGRGREGWTFRDYGQSTPQNIRSAVTGSAAFSPGALSTEMIDDLLDGGNVKNLADGVRVRRATNSQGTAWQELRWKFDDLTTWSWAFGGGHRMASFSINGSTGTGSNTKDSKIKLPGESGTGNRGGSNENAWFTFPWSAHGGSAGFSFSGNIGGQNNSTSYLWEFGTEDNAIPFTQVFLRPTILTPVLPVIADTGVPEQVLSPLLDDQPKELAGGVSGVLKVGDSESHVDTPVQAITTFGSRVYIGGKFSDVRDTATGQLVPHSYLAAFDRATGAWISSFAPALDGTVWDLAIADGKLIVAGQFTNVNGAPLSAGLAALDPTTGAVLPGWKASMQLSGSTARPYARAIDVEGTSVFVGGNFTSLTDSSGNTRSRGRLAMVSAANGSSNNTFTPNVDGVPYDVDASAGRVYVAGDFDSINGEAHKGVGVLNWTNGANVAGLAAPLYTTGNFDRQYQQAVLAVGGDVWQGGSEHNTHVYSAAGYAFLKGFITTGKGGDTQAFTLNNGVVYQGSHGNSWINTDGTTWPAADNYTRVDDYKWIGAFDASSRQHQTTWVPSLRSGNSEGAWELHTDADNCTWFGGDFTGGPYIGGQRQYLEGFSKFCQRDTQAPTVPANPSALVDASGIRVTWSGSSDDFPGYIGYEILRNDRVISPLVYGSVYVDTSGNTNDRYFVRAVDPAGNRSASTGVVSAAIPVDTIPPTAPRDLTAAVLPDNSVDLAWTASTDAVGVDAYLVFRNGVEIRQVPGTATTVNIADLGSGSHWLQVRAVDAAGNESYKTPSARVDIAGPDVQRPSVPGSPTATVLGDGSIDVSWIASVDDTGVTSYEVTRNAVVKATVNGVATTANLPGLGAGRHYIQVRAFDAAGNASFDTASVIVDIVGPDVQRPSVPTGLTGVVQPDGSIAVAWTASTDNVGVTSYEVTRNGVVKATVGGAVTTANLPGLGAGRHYIQVRAFDAAGNTSFDTPSTIVDIAGADAQRPSVPTGLTAAAQADGSIAVAWVASTDNVGVTSYEVTRNAVVLATVSGAETAATLLGLGAGRHYIQVRAFDAAGNKSFDTASVIVDIVGPDTQRPSSPTGLTAVAQPDGSIVATWNASNDNVGVTSYEVTRNAVVQATVDGAVTTATLIGLGAGRHYIQVRAFDAAGNKSFDTASVIVDL